MLKCKRMNKDVSATEAGLRFNFLAVPRINREKAMATHASTLAWKISWTEVTVHGDAKSRTQLCHFPFTFHFHALEKEMVAQYPCLENPRDGVAWWAAV